MALGYKRGVGVRALGRAPSLRALDPGAGGGAAPRPPDEGPSLRLALSRGALTLELSEPFALGPMRVTELAVELPGIRFPVDLTGGVARFRHRRGALARLRVEARAVELASWAAPRVRGLLGAAAHELMLAPFEDGTARDGDGDRAPWAGALVAIRAGEAALAFDVAIAPGERDLRLVPERARGVGLGAPPHALALRALAALVGAAGQGVDGAVALPDAIGRLVRHVLPAAGARAPAVGGVRWEAITGEAGAFRLLATAGAPPPALGDRALSALEAAELAGDADRAACEGDLDEARRRYLGALERAPRHPEIAARLAWIDWVVGGRAEGALATIVEVMPADHAGLLGAELLEAVGDRDGALAAFSRAAHEEPYGALAALAWLRAARLSAAPEDAALTLRSAGIEGRLEALDQGVARAPALDALRWARLEARLEVADLRGALADAEHLEAAARGAEARHAVWRGAAEAHLARGFLVEARRLFERALRYAPESPEAALGLARSLRAAGEGRRALDLLARARAIAERRGAAAHGIELELARGLAEIAGDRPAAIARAQRIPPEAAEALEARLLEGRCRAELGDAAGASLALGRLRDAVELELAGRGRARAARWPEPAPAPAPGAAVTPDAPAIGAMLAEAARIEERERGDLLAAQRHLGVALRLRPRDPAVLAAFRRVAGEVARAAPAAPRARAEEAGAGVGDAEEAEAKAPETAEAWNVPATALAARGGAAPVERRPAPIAPADDEVLVERLTDRLRADPDDHRTALALADALARLGRDLDLLALLSARMEEGGDEVREELAPLRHEVLQRLATQAREAGRPSEAELYEMMLAAP